MIFLFIFVSLIVAVYPLNIIVDNHGSTYVEEDEVILEKILNKTLKPLGAKKVEADNLDHQEGAYKLSVTTNQDKDPSDKKILEAFVNLGFTDAKISTIDVSQESSQEGSEGDEVEYLIQLNTSSMRKTMQSLAMQEAPTFKAKGSHFESDEDHDDDRDDHEDHDDDRDDHDDHDDDDDHDKYYDKNQNDDDHVKNVNVHDHDKSHNEDHDNKHHDTNNENKNHNNDHEEHDQNKNQHDKDHDRDSHEINEDEKHDKNHDDNHNNNDHDKVHKDKEQDDEDNDDADEDDDEE